MKILILLCVAVANAQWLSECGQSQYPDAGEGQEWTRSRRIVGGVQARDHEFPWQVSAEKSGSHFCGGNILNSQYVISAGHCFEGDSPSTVNIVTERIFRTVGGVSHNVEEIIVHESFNAFDFNNDIALLRTASDMDLSSERAKALCPPRQVDYVDAFLTTSGWGTTSFGGEPSNDLLYTNIIAVTNEDCGYFEYTEDQITPNMICALSDVDNRDACQGDSGGPLVFNNGGTFELVGLVSWGNGCGTYAGVYTRVSMFMDWLADNTV